MNKLFSNRFFQGGIAIAAIGIAFFAYQGFTGESTTTDVDASANEPLVQATETEDATPATTEVAAESNKVENAINNTAGSDTINTAVEEPTSK